MKKDLFEELIVVKRSGQRVNFNSYKIAVAIKNAFDSVSTKYDCQDVNKIYENVLKCIELNYETRKTINVEDIQDMIENELKKQNFLDIYEEFSQYRKKRAESRQTFTIKQQHKFAKAMEKISNDDLLRIENSYTPQELLLEYGNTVLKEFVKSYIIDNKYLRMHEEGNIYINSISNASLGRVSHTNLNIKNKLLQCTALGEILKYLEEASLEIDGEIHISSLDALLGDYFLKKIKIYLIKNINNYLNVAGFNNYISMDIINNLIHKSDYRNIVINLDNIALNDKVKDIFKHAYDDTIKEIKTDVLRELTDLLVGLNRTKKYYSFSFGSYENEIQKLVTEVLFSVLKENNCFNNVGFIYKFSKLDDIYLRDVYSLIHDNKNISLVNLNNNGNILKKLEVFSNGIRIYDNCNDDNYSLGRMIVSSTSINMARLGLIYKETSRDKFYLKLEEILDLVKSELLLMFEIIGNKTKENYNILFDDNILYDEKLLPGGKIRKVIKNSNLLIGLVGLKECVETLEIDSYKQYNLLIDILNFINLKCHNYREETKLNFYAYEPFQDNSRQYFMALDKSIYGIKKGITDKESYDLISNLKCLKNDYNNLGNVSNLLEGGNLVIKEIRDTLSYKKFIMILEDAINNNINTIKFRRSSG